MSQGDRVGETGAEGASLSFRTLLDASVEKTDQEMSAVDFIIWFPAIIS